MLKKPNDWENTQAYGDWEPLEPGGYICKIMGVEETKSRSGKDMLVISLDIAEGEFKDYYAQQYKSDNRAEKKWGCKVYQLLEDNEGNTNRGFKTFVSAVEKSNTGFDPNSIWGVADINPIFKGKLVGGVFGREQYENMKGDLKWSVKCQNFREIEDIKKGVKVPEDKYLNGQQPQQNASNYSSSSVDNDDFKELESDMDLPF